MRLTDQEKRMLDGRDGVAVQRAMDLLVRYAEALGAERFVDTNNVAGVPGSSTQFVHQYYLSRGGGDFEDIWSRFDLDSDESFSIPKVRGNCCHLQGGLDPQRWVEQGKGLEALKHQLADERGVTGHGVQLLKTCTPYLAGNVPGLGEHCAWMESSAVVYCNSMLGARTNTEGRESTSAAMLTGKIPDWGLHQDANRRGTHLIEVDIPMDSVMEWGMLGYFAGSLAQDAIPVIVGPLKPPNAASHKHFGAAAATSGGVEMYHVVGATPEAPTVERACGGHPPAEVIRYGRAERRTIYEQLNSVGDNASVDYAMLGCPHASLEQLREVAQLLDSKKLRTGCNLWIFTSRAVKAVADLYGYTRTIESSGALVMTDTCSAIGKTVPAGTKVVALNSAKQAHYLPAMMGVEAWFGTTQDCVQAVLTGRWSGALR